MDFPKADSELPVSGGNAGMRGEGSDDDRVRRREMTIRQIIRPGKNLATIGTDLRKKPARITASRAVWVVNDVS